MVEHALMVWWSLKQSRMEKPLGYFSFQPVLHDWDNKACVCMMVHIKDPLLIEKSDPCSGSSGFLLVI